MLEDKTGQYRDLLDEDSPEFTDRVENPWEEAPDLIQYNPKAYRLIRRKLKAMQRELEKKNGTISRGILILGEAGSGKTHLLMRIAQNIASTYHLMFVRKPNNEEAVAQHIWKNMIESLTRPVPNLSGYKCQLDSLLARVFSAILIPALEKDIANNKDPQQKQKWLKKLQEAPENLFTILGRGETLARNREVLRRRALNYLREQHPADVDLSIAHALRGQYMILL